MWKKFVFVFLRGTVISLGIDGLIAWVILWLSNARDTLDTWLVFIAIIIGLRAGFAVRRSIVGMLLWWFNRGTTLDAMTREMRLAGVPRDEEFNFFDADEYVRKALQSDATPEKAKLYLARMSGQLEGAKLIAPMLGVLIETTFERALRRYLS